MTNSEICAVLWELSTDCKTKLGVQHITWLLRRDDYRAIIANKQRPGYSLVPEAYRELELALAK